MLIMLKEQRFLRQRTSKKAHMQTLAHHVQDNDLKGIILCSAFSIKTGIIFLG